MQANGLLRIAVADGRLRKDEGVDVFKPGSLMKFLKNWAVSIPYAAVNAGLRVFQALLFHSKLPKEPKTVLVYRVGHLGDTWCAIPAMAALRQRYPKARFVLMTNSPEGKLPAMVDALDKLVDFQEVIAYEPALLRQRGFVGSLRDKLIRERIDLLVYLGLSIATPARLLRDMLFFKAAGCKSACGFKSDTLRIFVKTQRECRGFDRETERLMKLIKPLGIPPDVAWSIPEVPFALFPSDRKGTVVAVHPSAKHEAKKWPIERFAKVAGYLQEKHSVAIAVVGGEDSKPEAQVLLQALKGITLDFTGRATFLETADVLRRSSFLLSNDSGPVHLAAAVGTPVVGIYSARDFPNSWYPWGDQHEILRRDVNCQICYLETCPTMTCLKMISVEQVIEACEKILGRKRCL